MSENRHPNEVEAHDLLNNLRFCEYLDANHALGIGWPHSTYSARRWLVEQCSAESLGQLGTGPEAATAFAHIAKRFRVWDQNHELEL